MSVAGIQLRLLGVLLILYSQVHSQKDSLGIYLESEAAFSSKDYLPFWVVHNQEARYTDRGADAWLDAGLRGWQQLDSQIKLTYTLEGVLKSPLQTSFAKQYNISLRWKMLEAIGGRFYDPGSPVIRDLGTGSLIQSRNAIPVPRVGFAVKNYYPVPYTKNWLQFKGSLYHGWFESDRALSSAWLHEKSAYLRLASPFKVGLSWGLVHVAMWGGTDRFGNRWTRGFTEDYYRVFAGRGAAEEQSAASNVRLEGSNRQGNHLGIWDIRIDYASEDQKFELYYERLWEDQWSLNHIFNEDAKWGLAWRSQKQEPGFVNAIVVEFLHTLLQRGPGLPDSVPGQSNYGYDYGGRDDYYNNWLYQSGWTYEGRVIGNPLFLTDDRAEKYFGSINNYQVKIVNNRFWAAHLGMEGNPNKYLRLKAKMTYSRNYGTYAGINGGRFKWGSKESTFVNSDYPYLKPLDQLSTMVEAIYSPPGMHLLSFNLGFAADIGEMTENYGAFIGMKWNVPH
jgi:hypothetical protein